MSMVSTLMCTTALELTSLEAAMDVVRMVTAVTLCMTKMAISVAVLRLTGILF
jgi:hypothetical protein